MIITILRKPLEGTVAENTLKHGCGALNIDGTRVAGEPWKWGTQTDISGGGFGSKRPSDGNVLNRNVEDGRWPANFILRGKEAKESLDNRNEKPSEFFKQFKKDKEMEEMIEYFKIMILPPVDDACVVVGKPSEIEYEKYRALESASLVPIYEPTTHGVILLDEPTEEEALKLMSILKPGGHIVLIPKEIGYVGVISLENQGFEVRDAIFVASDPDSFHYCSKTSRSEREAGLTPKDEGRANTHPTVKPIEIMEWCARDIGTESKVVDPFLGSGTTGIAMSRKGYDFVGIELQPEYAKICEARIRHWMPHGTEILSEAKVGKREPEEGETISIFDLF